MATAPQGPKLVTSEPAATFHPPRGPVVNARWIVRHYHTDPDTGEALVSEKWVRETLPNKVRLSQSVVGWFRDDVVEYYERLRAQAGA